MKNSLVRLERRPTVAQANTVEVLPEFERRLMDMVDELRMISAKTTCPSCASWVGNTADRLQIIRSLVKQAHFVPENVPFGTGTGHGLMIHGEKCREFWSKVNSAERPGEMGGFTP